MEAVLNETQVKDILGVSLACLRRWRLLGQGPRYRKVGSRVKYRPADVTLWFEKQPTGGDGQRLEKARRVPVHSMAVSRTKAASKSYAAIETASAA